MSRKIQRAKTPAYEEQEPRPQAKPAAEKLFKPSRIKPKSEGQSRYLRAIEQNAVTFVFGPPGCGKTCLAVAKAVEALDSKDVLGITIIRPHLGLGRTMGFQPGDLLAKMSHYMRPIFDELSLYYAPAQLKKLIEDEVIEVAALEFVRGRNFNNRFVILDEAQNATYQEMKAFLTRLGRGSTYVVDGDVTRGDYGGYDQSDLPLTEQGAVEEYANRFADLDGVEVVTLTTVDCQRHPLVRAMMERGFRSSRCAG